MILQKGSNGDNVKTLQRVLNRVMNANLVEDGDFGPATEKAVKEFQKKHAKECGEADGIVGAKTFEALGISQIKALGVKQTTNSKCIDPSVVYAPLNCCVSKSPNRTIKYLAIHYTAGASSASGKAKSMKSGWELKRRASADFGVDDANMVQFNPDLKNYHCWSVGDAKKTAGGGAQLFGKAINRNTISIEICSNLRKGTTAKIPNHEGWTFTEAAINNAVRLAKILMQKYNIPIDRVVRHYDVSGKICPGVAGWNNASLYTTQGAVTKEKNNSDAWFEFKRRLIM